MLTGMSRCIANLSDQTVSHPRRQLHSVTATLTLNPAPLICNCQPNMVYMLSCAKLFYTLHTQLKSFSITKLHSTEQERNMNKICKLKSTISWDVRPCSLAEVPWHFGGMSVEIKRFRGTLVHFHWTTWCYTVLYMVTTVRTLNPT
jgi:hypothetical protein